MRIPISRGLKSQDVLGFVECDDNILKIFAFGESIITPATIVNGELRTFEIVPKSKVIPKWYDASNCVLCRFQASCPLFRRN
jgi:hypothetical protein